MAWRALSQLTPEWNHFASIEPRSAVSMLTVSYWAPYQLASRSLRFAAIMQLLAWEAVPDYY